MPPSQACQRAVCTVYGITQVLMWECEVVRAMRDKFVSCLRMKTLTEVRHDAAKRLLAIWMGLCRGARYIGDLFESPSKQ